MMWLDFQLLLQKTISPKKITLEGKHETYTWAFLVVHTELLPGK